MMSIGDIHSILHSINEGDDITIQIKNGELSNQYENWEYGIKNWLEEDTSKYILQDSLNNRGVEVQKQSNIFQILSPLNNQIFKIENNIKISVISSIVGISRYDYYIDNKLIGTSHLPSFNFTPLTLGINDGKHLVRVIGYSKQNSLNISEVSIEIKN